MVRLKGQDNLSDLVGKLTPGFNSTNLGPLGKRFARSSPDAQRVLTDFFLAATKYAASETEFNNRAKPDAPNHLANLRSGDQMLAVREFTNARETLLALNPNIGGHIVGAVESSIASTTKPAAAKPTVKRSFAAAVPSGV
jgi:hypothetical protein